MAKKRARRIAETNAQLEEAMDSRAANELLAGKADDDLFVVDRAGSKTSRRKIEKEKVRKEQGVLVSATEEHLIKKKMKELAQKEASAAKTQNVSKVESLDIWGADDGGGDDEIDKLLTTTRRTQPKDNKTKKAAKVVGPGFSYNPAQVHHQDALAEAMALEMKKREKDAKDNALFAKKMTGIIANGDGEGDSDDEDDDEDEDEDDDAKKAAGKPSKKKKMKEKLTTAERNKQKKNKAMDTQFKKDRAVKTLEKQVEQWPHMLKNMEKEKKTMASKKALKDIAAQSHRDGEDAAMSYVESANVPLSDELGGSLRTLIPKGSSVKNMSIDYDSAGKTEKKGRGVRVKGAHPHRAQNVKWVARHKYV
jgi:nucleolar protein 53